MPEDDELGPDPAVLYAVPPEQREPRLPDETIKRQEERAWRDEFRALADEFRGPPKEHPAPGPLLPWELP